MIKDIPVVLCASLHFDMVILYLGISLSEILSHKGI
jgi:hypothetical protein